MTLCALHRFPSKPIRSFLEHIGQDVAAQEAVVLVGDSRVSKRDSKEFADGALKLYMLSEDIAVAVAGNVVLLRKVLTRMLAEVGSRQIEPMALAEMLRNRALEASDELGLREPPECAFLLAARHPTEKTVWGFVIDFQADPPLRVVTDMALIGPQELSSEYQQVMERIDRDNPDIPIAPDQLALRMYGAVAAVAGHHPRGVVGIPISCIIMSHDQTGYYP